MKEYCRLLIETICQICRSGLEADERLIDYVDASFSCPSLVELKQVIDDDLHPDREGLLELIFFPDEKTRYKIEEAIGNVVFSDGDVETVTNELARCRLRTTLFFRDGRGTLPIDLPREMTNNFVLRLNLTRRLEGKLLDSLEGTIDPSNQTIVKVKLRNVRKKLSELKVHFLAGFFEKMGGDRQFFECLDFMLNVMEEINSDADVFNELAKRRQACQHQIQESERFAEKLLRENIEMLMMRRERITHLSKHELRKKLALIDKISLSVFGRIATSLSRNIGRSRMRRPVGQ